VVAWDQRKPLTTAAHDKEIDVSDYDYDLVFTLADTSITSEQYVVLVDSKEVGKTQSRSW